MGLWLGGVAAALSLVACGGGDEAERAATPAPTPRAAATPGSPQPSPDSATATPAPSPTATLGSPEEQEGGAGDEEAARVPVDFTIDGEGITPPRVEVPAFLALELVVRNDTPRAQTVTLAQTVLEVRAGETARTRRSGLRPGRYRVDAGVAGVATLVAGAEPGP